MRPSAKRYVWAQNVACRHFPEVSRAPGPAERADLYTVRRLVSSGSTDPCSSASRTRPLMRQIFRIAEPHPNATVGPLAEIRHVAADVVRVPMSKNLMLTDRVRCLA